MAETGEWVDPDGSVTTWRVLYDTRGRFGPPPRIEQEAVPGQPGARIREATHDVREFLIPVHVSGTTDAELRATLRDMVYAMDPTRGDGKWRFTTPTGDQREITCRVVAGLDVDESPGRSTPTDQLMTLVCRAVDPYWYEVSDILSPEYVIGAVATFFPIFPIRLSSSEVFADLQIDNTGDLEVWPVWYVTGPGSSVTVNNLSTGKTLTSTFVLATGETATIDTRPGHKTVVRGDGANLFGYIIGSLWPLRRGSNAVRVEMGAATADTKVQLAYRLRYYSI